MQSLQHVSVWLDSSPADESLFPQAMDWAFRLNLPLRAIVTASRFSTQSTDHASVGNRSHTPVVEKMRVWGNACAQRGIVLELFLSLRGGELAMDQFLRSHGLCVFVEKASSEIQDELMVRSSRNREIAILMCPPTSKPMTRIMVLYDQTHPNATYLESVARLCQVLEIHPIILIVAKTESEAHLKQGYAEGVCNSVGLLADCDFVVGCELRSTVSRVASWRGCSHLIIERQNTRSWWQGMSGDLLERFRRVSDSLSILALPEAAAFDVPPRIRSKKLGLLRNSSTEPKPISTQECALTRNKYRG